eukprot:CAMPEP_0194073356 /NCGR_PEP_ID=MMETSP0149-20130528/818_1 /TAXON_ID=122233 /ORGANISM="Chaetoceros debilis, Strain MM31A-1" /LENGTH=59 /DNA_ID=CAMNT_0038753369 /DNA_START=229 /DNA_END=405 /DNA_ORIENTATION=+
MRSEAYDFDGIDIHWAYTGYVKNGGTGSDKRRCNYNYGCSGNYLYKQTKQYSGWYTRII